MYRIPRSVYQRFKKLYKIFGFKEALKAMFGILSNPLNPRKVVVSCYSVNLGKNICFRPASSDMFVLGQVFIDNEFDYNIEFAPDFMIDGGAHCGFASLYFLSKFPDMRIIAIEPELGNFSLLKKNIGDIEGVTLINKPLASKSKNVSLSNPDAKSPSFQYKESKNTDSQKAITIPQVLGQYEDNFRHGILKLDIEGAEKEIFIDNPEDWIHKFDIIFVEPHDWIHQGTEEVIINAAKKNNRKIDKIGENIILNINYE